MSDAKRTCLCLSAAVLLFATAAFSIPVIIYDSDIGPDVDDAGAAGVLNALADLDQCIILGMGCCTGSKYGAPCLDAINTYYSRPDIPIGTFKGDANFFPTSKYNRQVVEQFPNDMQTGDNAPDVISLYRELLASQPDNSVTFVVVGFKNNMANLLKSAADGYSDLNGFDLVKKKVFEMVDMGGSYPDGEGEYNFKGDPLATKYMYENWPTRIIVSGGRVSYHILTGACLGTAPAANPVRKAYALYNEGDGGTRMSWDLTAILIGVRGAEGYWDTGLGYCQPSVDGKNKWLPPVEGVEHIYIKRQTQMSDADITIKLDSLLCKAPRGPVGVSNVITKKVSVPFFKISAVSSDVTVKYDLCGASSGSLEILSQKGRVLEKVELGNQQKGSYLYSVKSLAAGLYIVKLNHGPNMAATQLLPVVR